MPVNWEGCTSWSPLRLNLPIERMASFSKGYPLFLNMEPSSLSDDKLLKKIVALSRRMNLPLSNIVIELTEREIITNFEHVRSALAPYRKEGLKLAVDDLGEGYSRLRSVIELEPEYIKIDRNIVSNVHRHKLKQRIISAIVEASKDFSHVIAEGIENAEELRMLQKIGLKFGQGFFLGRPGKLQE